MYLFSDRERQREVMHSWKKYQLACVHKWKMMHSYLWLRGKYKELRLMGPCGTDSRLHLHCGREQSLWILVTRGVQCGGGVEWLCTGVHGTVPFARESCLSGQAMHGATWLLFRAMHACFQTILDHKTCCRWFCSVSVVHYADNSYQI